MKLNDFIGCISRGEIPPKPPERLNGEDWERSLDGRRECISRGMWAMVEQTWTQELADWIGNRDCLEIMAGAGWLAKALFNKGVAITATDDYSWDGNQHSKDMKRVHPVSLMHSIDAVLLPVAEVLIVSWPPYGGSDIIDACRLWGPERPVVYIGEGVGGCNAPEEFFKYFDTSEDPGIHLPTWWGLHDQVMIGYYNE